MLLATYRSDGTPAPLPAYLGGQGNTMVAQATPAEAVGVPAPRPSDAVAASSTASEAKAILAAYQPDPAPEMGDEFLAPTAYAEPAGAQPTMTALVALPPERPASLGGAPAAVVPVGGEPTAPAVIPLPPERNADLGGSDRLTVAEIVGIGRREAGPTAALAFASLDPAVGRPHALYVDTGLVETRAEAETLRWVLSQTIDTQLYRIETHDGTMWRVEAGPFDDKGEASAVVTMARSAGAADAGIID